MYTKDVYLEKGDKVRITTPSGWAIGTVLTASWYEDAGWYIELDVEEASYGWSLGYSYYKQRDDGGTVEKLELEEEQTNLYHGIGRADELPSILYEGLRVGSSVSDQHGQAFTYPIFLKYGSISVEGVSYRPGDYVTKGPSGNPLAIYVCVEDFGAGIRPIDEIDAELAVRLADLESQGVSPEEVAAMPRHELARVDKRTAELLKELDKSIDMETEGVTRILGGEDVLKEVKRSADGIPVYRISRDEEGEINWESAISV